MVVKTFVFSPASSPNFNLPLPPGDAIIQIRPERGKKVRTLYRSIVMLRKDGSQYIVRERTTAGL